MDGDTYAVMMDASRGEFGGYDHEKGTGDYTVYIYDYIVDHAGNSITASDVKWSFEYQHENAATSGWNAFQGIDVVDDTTCVFRFDHDLDKIDELKDYWAACFVISEKTFTDSPSDLTAEMIGTGPYVMDEYVTGAKVVLKRNENYWQTNEELVHQFSKANVEKINYVFINDQAQQVIALKTGEVDVVASVMRNDVVDFKEGGEYADRFTVFVWKQQGQLTLMANCAPQSICNDINMRLAIYNAVDVQGFAAALGADSVEPAKALMSNSFSDYNPEWDNWDNYQTNPSLEKAKEYLAQANYNGEKLVLICEASVAATDCEIVQSMLSQIGVNVEIQTFDKSGYELARANPEAYDIAIDRLAGPIGVIQLSRLWNTSNTKDGLTYNHIDDPEWQAMLELILTVDGHTTENIDAWMQHAYDNAYGKALYMQINNIVYRNNIESIVRTNKRKLLPGGFEYSAE